MEQHILPHNDIGIHIENTTCNCNPAVIFKNNNMIVIHNAFDKREQNECKHNPKLSKMGYVAAHNEAERRLKKGQKQVQCLICKLWFFKDEY